MYSKASAAEPSLHAYCTHTSGFTNLQTTNGHSTYQSLSAHIRESGNLSRYVYSFFWHWVTLQGACTQSVFVLNFSFPFSCFITLTLGFKRKVHWIITNLFAFLGEGSLVGINLEYMAESSHKLIPKYGIGSAGECEPFPSTLPNGW